MNKPTIWSLSAAIFTTLLGSSSALAAGGETPRLKAAYQEEVAYLREEQRALKTLRDDLDKALQAAQRDLAQKRAARTAELSRLRRESAALERSLVLLEDQAAQRDAVRDQLETLVAAARGDTLAARLRAAVDTNVTALAALGAVTKAPGTFFNPAGEEVNGTVVHVGGVAAYGLLGGRGFVLTPVGGGALKASTPLSAEAIERIARGDAAGTVPVLLWPDKDVAFTPRAEKTFADTLRAAGPIGGVIVALFCLGVLLILARAGLLLSAARKVDKYRFGIVEQAIAHNLAACRALCEQHGVLRRAVGPVIDAAHLDWDAREDIAGEGVLAASETLERFSTVILVIAAVAPLLGLLGTVTGMIATFDSITAFGTGDPRVLSGGISEALITTELGLIVAITSLFLGQVLAAYGQRTLGRLESCALSVAHALADNPAHVVRADVRRHPLANDTGRSAPAKEVAHA